MRSGAVGDDAFVGGLSGYGLIHYDRGVWRGMQFGGQTHGISGLAKPDGEVFALVETMM